MPIDRLILNGMEFCRVPAGKFVMGSADSDSNAENDEKPQHTLEIPYDYWMARFPITNAQYVQYISAIRAKNPLNGWQDKKDHPVDVVSWNEAKVYSKWINDALKGQVPTHYALRLPSEAEWEKAARGTHGNIWPWGDKSNPENCHYIESKPSYSTTSVSAHSPQGDSPYGCADMAGNVYEWTRSLFKPYPYNPNDGREVESVGGCRVLRGGSRVDVARRARCAYRLDDPINAMNGLGPTGFRLVVSPILS